MSNAPKPTALKLIQGNPGHRELPKKEPKLPVKVPRAPADLSPTAKKHWRKVVRQLADAGVMTDIDTHALAMYCEAFTRYRFAMCKISKEGPIIHTKTGYPIQHPAMGVLNKAFDQMRAILTEFGMTPSSRTRVQVAEAADDDPLGDMMRGR